MTHEIKYATGIDIVNCNEALFEFVTHSPEYLVEYVGLSENVTRDQIRALGTFKK